MTAGRSLGQFYPVASPLHGLDARAKILDTGILAVGLFLVDSVAGLLLISAVVALLVAASRVPPGTFVGFLRPVVFIVALTVLFQVFFSREGEMLLRWGFLEVHEGGITTGLFLALRILLLVSTASLLTATTAPIALTDSIEDLLSPLKRLRFPAHELAMMTTIALRFIPTLHDEAQKIMRAQAARGADFSEGGPIRRAQAMLPVLVALTIGAFRSADELAEAMESRGYRGGEGRTRYREQCFRARDALGLGAAVLVVVGGVLV